MAIQDDRQILGAQQSKDFFLVFDLSPDLMCLLDGEGLLIRANREFLQFSPQPFSGAAIPFTSLLHPGDLLSYNRFTALGEHYPVFSGRLRTEEGAFITVEWRKSRWQDGGWLLSGRRSAKSECANAQECYQDTATILESIGDAFFTIDQHSVIRYWNRQAERIFGYARTEVLGRNIWDCLAEDQGGGFFKKYREALKLQLPVYFEEFLTGQQRWVEAALYPCGQAVTVYIRDINERRQREQSLRDINERYRLLSKATAGAIWDWNLRNDTIYFHDENFRNLFGHSVVNDYLPFDVWENSMIHPQDRERVLSLIRQALSEERDFWFTEYRLKKADGEYAHVRVRGYTHKDETGFVSNMIGCIEDITVQKLAEAALLESEKGYRKLFNNAPVPQAIYDMETLRFLKVNKAMISHYGYSKEEFLSMSTLDIRPAEEVEKLAHFIEHIRSAEDTVHGIWTHIKKNGESIIVESSATAVFYQGKRAVLVAMNDITEKVRLEEKITMLKVSEQKKITRAQIKGQENERLEIGRELHDNINQQLTTVKLYLDLASAKEELRLDLVRRSEKVLNNTINEIRAISKTLISPTLHDVGLSEALNELVESYRVTGRFNIHFFPPQGLNSLTEELTVTLFRILQEQLVNISRYAEAQNIWIVFNVQKSHVGLEVKDDGKGFHPSKKRTGVGLTNIKNRTELYNGTMVLESSPGNGCRLYVQIPLEEAPPDGANVLVAEDDEDDQLLLKEAFNEVAPHHKLTFVVNGRQLIHYLDTLPDPQLPSLIVLDYKMPVMGGLDTLKELQISQRYRHIPKIVYSTTSKAAYREMCISANATAYLEKKPGFAEIKESIREMLSFCS